jgi:hypothetical protein
MTDSHDADLVIVMQILKWQVDVVGDTESVEAQAQVLKNLVNSSGSCRSSEERLGNGTKVTVASNPTIAFGWFPIVQTQASHSGA